MSGPTNKRFVRSAWTLLAFQFVAAAGATALAIWAATRVQDLVDQRDLLQQRVTALEARPAPVPPVAGTPMAEGPIVPDNGATPVPPPPPPPPKYRPDRPDRTRAPPTGGTTVGPGAGGGPPPPPTPPPARRAAEFDPRYANQLQPPYPPSELRAQREGRVQVRVTIAPSGLVSSVVRLAATSDAFWRVTEQQALSRWRFRPATVDGRPVEDTKVMNLRFQLVDERTPRRR
ncbi:MAG: periplasmic protein TonB [Sphingomonadales bacterium]|jgi:protein TonB|nr:periplasmic protein TonB [Sphingomonadales bacterium]